MRPRELHNALTPAAVRYIRRWKAQRRQTGKRTRPLRKELCARWGISPTCFEDAASGRRYGWVE